MSDQHELRGNRHSGGRPRRRLGVSLVCAFAFVALLANGAAAMQARLATPHGLRTFELRPDEARVLAAGGAPVFSRTPSFAWTPVRGATQYDFELSTSERFNTENGLVWSGTTRTTPAISIPLSLPWMTGDPAFLHWRVRARHGTSLSPWSASSPFVMQWTNVPQQQAGGPGFVQWTPVDGATGYDVWLLNLATDSSSGAAVASGKIISTTTTVADTREYYTMRSPGSVALWRVRAERRTYGATANSLPAVSYGPWSGVYSSPVDAPSTSGAATPLAAVSDVTSNGNALGSHAVMPAFVFSNGDGQALHRVYIASDRGCVNIVFRGAIVGGQAYAPRTTGTLGLDLPQWDSTHQYVLDGSEGTTMQADGKTVTATEAQASVPASSASSSNGASGSTGAIPRIDLWDTGSTGRYYWTVVPVGRFGTRYQDTVLPQDACAAGRVLSFAKRSAAPLLADQRTKPYALGLSPSGRLLTAVRSNQFYGPALVGWTPATAAASYDVEWTRSRVTWPKKVGLQTPATSAVLPLAPGTWWYRVRGVNEALPGNQAMSWSNPARIRLSKPTFAVVGGR
jgi:hypothetical protein